MGYFCNPLNVEYRYQFNKTGSGAFQVSREAADPSMVYYQNRYYLFASMTLEVWESEDMAAWKSHRLPDCLPLYDYAPDVRVIGGYVYFSASRRGEKCDWFRTKDPVNGPYEKIEGTFDFWDPNLFSDDDGRVYFYWGCTNNEPLYGVELNPVDMKPIGEKKPLIYGNINEKGYERGGEDHSALPLSAEALDEKVSAFLSSMGVPMEKVPPEKLDGLRLAMDNKPFIEGAWMDKHNGKYYLQYACPGTECNVYADGVYISDCPLGPFVLAKNNPYSYKPGGFAPGAGHGSTVYDRHGNLWHSATMRISVNHIFERRVGIWPAGFDKDGELFCNQRYGDWPVKTEQGRIDPFAEPGWFLLGYKVKMTASSFTAENDPAKAADENIRTWWKAATNKSGEWIQMDLGQTCDIHAVQINFADDKMPGAAPPQTAVFRQAVQPRYIEERKHCTKWKLEASEDGTIWSIVMDKSDANTNLPHDLIVDEAGFAAQYLRLTVFQTPFDAPACISGLRVFGIAEGEKPNAPVFEAARAGDLDMEIWINRSNAVGYNILWGHEPRKLYHSYMVFENYKKIGALVKGQPCFVRVDAFNRSGITEGPVIAAG